MADTPQIREMTLEHLERVAPSVIPQFLEYLINVEHDEWPKYHNMLIRCYVRKLLPMLTEYRKEMEGMCCSGSWRTPTYSLITIIAVRFSVESMSCRSFRLEQCWR